MPLGRIMAAFILASLISTLFALPSFAAGPVDVGVTTVSAPANGANVKVGTNVVYTITVTNNDPDAPASVTLTDNIGSGTFVSAPGCTNPPVTCTSLSIPGGGTWVVTITVNASTTGTLTNVATVTETGDVNAANDSATNTVTVVASLSDITVVKGHTAATLTPGSDVTYNLQVSNAGPDPATGVSVSDTLDPALTFKSSASGCTAAAQVVTCPVPDVAAGGSQTVSFVATIGLSVPIGTVIANTASVSTSTAESNATNNTSNIDSLTVAAAPIDLGIALIADPTTVAPGGKVTFTVGVQNLSTTADATNVVVTDTLPTGLAAFTPPTTPTIGTVAVANNVWTWTIPTVAKSSTVTATFDATVDPATTLTTITNTAGITTADQTDPVTTNNTASVDLTIQAGVADLDVTSAVDDAKPNKGDEIAIAIQIANAGPDDATNVVLKDVLPNGLKYRSCTGCEASGGKRRAQWTGSFPIASIPADSSATIILNVLVQAGDGTLKNTASIQSSDQTDPDGSNDTSSLKITVGTATNASGGGGASGGSGGGSGGTSGTSGAGGTAFTGFSAGQLVPWFLILFTVGLAALEYARRRPLVAAIGHTYGFDPWI